MLKSNIFKLSRIRKSPTFWGGVKGSCNCVIPCKAGGQACSKVLGRFPIFLIREATKRQILNLASGEVPPVQSTRASPCKKEGAVVQGLRCEVWVLVVLRLRVVLKRL